MARKTSARKLLTWIERPYVRPVLLLAVAGLIIFQIVMLSPSPLEEARSPDAPLDPETLERRADKPLASGIPTDIIPDYTVEKFEYVSVQNGEKQWKLQADKAFLYNQDKLVHAVNVKAFLYDADGKITVVTGLEAKYFMNQRDLEMFGDVEVVFPDGFNISTEYLRYLPAKKYIQIPVQYKVIGKGDVEGAPGQRIRFQSSGLDWEMANRQKKEPEIVLPQAVRFVFENATSSEGTSTIVSDRCVIEKSKQLAHFSMSAKRTLEKRFVEIFQVSLWAKARKVDLNYGNTTASKIQYMTLLEDVLIRELGKDKSLQYATGGRAEFDSNQNVIVLSEFPQVYQDNDTVTGDLVVLHRDTDVVEVQNSNAYSQGSPSQQ